MIPNYNKVHNKFKLKGFHYSYDELRDVAYSFIKEGEPYQIRIGEFLHDWTDSSESILVQTSGSTGAPKAIRVSKQHMVNSAIATGDFFKLQPGKRALHCLPTDFIAGKMMLVRAIILGLELDCIEPSATPIFRTDYRYDFCAMVPMQLQNSLKTIGKIKLILVGGTAVSQSLQSTILGVKTRVFESYGMTETVSHIAIKALNGQNNSDQFNALNGITLSQDSRSCLVIEAPQLSHKKVITNDMVQLLSPTQFRFLGRIDNVINSGGVKLFPEQIEFKLASQINRPFFIASKKDEVLGEKLILIVEGHVKDLDLSSFQNLDKFEFPKSVYFLPHFVRTKTNKINRKETLELIEVIKD